MEAIKQTVAASNEVTRQKLVAVQEQIAKTYVEREELAEGIMLAIVCKAHICVVGPPGAAKSAVLDTLQGVFTDAKFFDTLFNRFLVEDDVFGPRSLTALKQDRWERVTDGYLADSEFANLDEIFKANGSILNALLKILNERKYAGAQRPLWTAVAASNELQEDESLDALWDRFLLRLEVKYVESESAFKKLIAKRAPKFVAPYTISMDELKAAHEEAMSISPKLSDAVLTEMMRIRKTLATQGVTVSDRRWIAVGDLLRAAAWLDGASEVELDHLGVLRFALWKEPAQIVNVKSVLASLDQGPVQQASKIIDDAVRLWQSRAADAAEFQAQQFTIATKIEEANKALDALVSQGVTKRAAERIAKKREALTDAHRGVRQALAARLGLGGGK
jgi:MoxR-like ATPase